MVNDRGAKLWNYSARNVSCAGGSRSFRDEPKGTTLEIAQFIVSNGAIAWDAQKATSRSRTTITIVSLRTFPRSKQAQKLLCSGHDTQEDNFIHCDCRAMRQKTSQDRRDKLPVSNDAVESQIATVSWRLSVYRGDTRGSICTRPRDRRSLIKRRPCHSGSSGSPHKSLSNKMAARRRANACRTGSGCQGTLESLHALHWFVTRKKHLVTRNRNVPCFSKNFPGLLNVVPLLLYANNDMPVVCQVRSSLSAIKTTQSYCQWRLLPHFSLKDPTLTGLLFAIK